MFDFFGPSMSQIQEVTTSQAINYSGLAMLLVEKGVFTEDELLNAISRATPLVDQAISKVKEAAQKEYDTENPGVREMLTKMMGGD